MSEGEIKMNAVQVHELSKAISIWEMVKGFRHNTKIL